jgi:polar amino acid transport system substrate-binding protein
MNDTSYCNAGAPRRIKAGFFERTVFAGRRILLAGLAGFAVMAAAAVSSQAGTLAEIKARGVLNVVTEDDFYPYEFITNGAPDGFHKDIVEELRKYAPFKVKQDPIPWSSLLASVTAGKYDVAITGAGVTAERLATFDYVSPISIDTTYYIKRANDDRIKSLKDLNGLTVGVQAGSAQLARLTQLDEKLKATGGKLGKVVQYPSYPEIYADLANGRLDYVVNSVVNASVLVREKPIFALGEPIAGTAFIAWPVAKGNEDLLEYLTGFVKHLRETGKLEELQKKWFGMTFPNLPQEPIKTPEQMSKLAAEYK